MKRKLLLLIACLLCFCSVRAQLIEYDYWFDNNFAGRKTETISGNTADIHELDAGQLAPGFHRWYLRVKKSVNPSAPPNFPPEDFPYSGITSGWFYKTPLLGEAKLEYWYNDDFDHLKEQLLPTFDFTLTTDLEVQDMPWGLNRINFRVAGGTVYQDYVLKTVAGASNRLEYWFDDDYIGRKQINSNVYAEQFTIADNIDVDGLSDGVHRIHYRLVSNVSANSPVYTDYFFKGANPYGQIGGEQFITEYVYWFDEDIENADTVRVTPTKTLDLITDIAVPSTLTGGEQTFNIKFKDNFGQWSETAVDTFQHAETLPKPWSEIQLFSRDGTRSPIGVAADGEAQLEIRVIKKNDNAPNVKDVDFQLSNSNGQTGKLSGGQSNIGGYYSIIYTAPNHFDGIGSLKEQQVEAVITYEDNTTETLTAEINIIRPPVMLVHGLNSSSDAFVELYDRLVSTAGLINYYDWQVWNVDYSATNKASFEDNKQIVVPPNLKFIINRYNLYGYEAKKADVVGHSMGGLLTRQYLQSDNYDYNINRFITLNTPHSGSQGANLLESYDILTSIVRLTMFKGEAVTDLCVDSKAIAKLNGAELNKNKVPSHAIVTTAELHEALFDLAGMEIAINIVLEALGYSLGDIYNEPSDLIVAKSSQEGGLGNGNDNDAYVSLFKSIWHTRSPGNNNVLDRVIELLNTPPNSSIFSKNGYNPPVLETIHPYKESPAIRSSEQSEIRITNIDKQECRNNETVKINIKGSNNVTKMSLIIEDEYNKFYMVTKEGNENEFVYEVPSYGMGEKEIFAIGYTNDGTIAVDSAKITITNNVILVSIETYTKGLILPLEAEYTIRLRGLYSDDIYRNTGYLEGMTYSSVNGNITFKSPNILIGNSIGLDTLIVSYNGIEAKMSIEVIDLDAISGIKEIQSEKSAQELEVTLYPNPVDEEFSLFIKNANKEKMVVSIYNMQGQKIEEQIIAGDFAVFNISHYRRGIYFVQIMTESGQSATKKLIRT